jgi:hypothetical protein
MADDKGGGSDWGALEIILGVLLLIGLLERVSLFGSKGTGTTTQPSTEQSSRASCGLEVTAPTKDQKVAKAVVVSGTAGTCRWEVKNNIALFAQIVDAKGAPLSDYTPIAPQEKNKRGAVSFSGVVMMTETPTTKTGFLFLVPASPESSHTSSVRIPLSF